MTRCDSVSSTVSSRLSVHSGVGAGDGAPLVMLSMVTPCGTSVLDDAGSAGKGSLRYREADETPLPLRAPKASVMVRLDDHKCFRHFDLA